MHLNLSFQIQYFNHIYSTATAARVSANFSVRNEVLLGDGDAGAVGTMPFSLDAFITLSTAAGVKFSTAVSVPATEEFACAALSFSCIRVPHGAVSFFLDRLPVQYVKVNWK